MSTITPLGAAGAVTNHAVSERLVASAARPAGTVVTNLIPDGWFGALDPTTSHRAAQLRGWASGGAWPMLGTPGKSDALTRSRHNDTVSLDDYVASLKAVKKDRNGGRPFSILFLNSHQSGGKVLGLTGQPSLPQVAERLQSEGLLGPGSTLIFTGSMTPKDLKNVNSGLQRASSKGMDISVATRPQQATDRVLHDMVNYKNGRGPGRSIFNGWGG